MAFKKEISDKWFYFPVMVLVIYWIYRLVDYAKLMWVFPFDYINDISSYMAQLFFLDVCGYHAVCNYWYNGFITFVGYAPGWFFFAWPLFKIIGNVQIASYVSILLMFLISGIFIYLIGKSQKLSKIRIISFFAFFFMNAINIGDFLRLGRVTTLFGWMVFLAFASVIYYYKDKKLDWLFFVYFIISYTILLFSHPQEIILGQFLLLGFFLVNKNKFKIIFVSIVGVILSSFWWLDYIKFSFSSNLINFKQAERLFVIGDGNLFTFIASLIIPFVFLLVFYFYWVYKNKSKKELLFYSPVLVLAVLFLFRIVVFVPVLQNISPDSYMIFFLFFIILLFLKTKRFNIVIANLTKVFLILFVVLSIFINIIHTPLFAENVDTDKDVLFMLSYVKGNFLITDGLPKTSYYKAFYSYAPIYHNLETASGWANIFASKEHLSLVHDVMKIRDCNKFVDSSKILNVTDVISYGERCIIIKECGWKEVIKKGEVCLYRNEV